MIPNNIILDFYSNDVVLDEKQGTITFPATKKSAWVIDGQHRLFGFDFEPPVSAVPSVRPPVRFPHGADRPSRDR